MTRTGKFVRGIGMGYVNQIVLTVAGLWLTPFLLSSLGRDQYGLWLVATQLLVYLTLLDFGIVAILPREIAHAVGHAGSLSSAGLEQLIGRTLRVVLGQTFAALLVAMGILWLLPAEWESVRTPLLVVLAVFVAMFPFRICQAVLSGLQDIAYLGVVYLVTWLFGSAVTVALVINGYGINSLAAGWAVTQVGAAIGWTSRLVLKYPRILPRSLPPFERQLATAQLRGGMWISVAQISVVLVAGADILLIGKILGPAYVVVYAITDKLITVLANQPQMLMQAAVPGLSQMRTSAMPSEIVRVASALSQGMLIITGLVFCVVLAINHAFVWAWVGKAQYGGLSLTVLLLLEMLLRHINTSAIYTNFCFGKERRIAIINIIDGSVSVVAAAILLPLIGVKGAALGLVIGVTVISLPANYRALFAITGTTAKAFMRPTFPWAVRFVPLAILCGIIQAVWTPPSLVMVAILAILVAGLYGLVMLPCVLEPPLSIYMPERLTRPILMMTNRLRLATAGSRQA